MRTVLATVLVFTLAFCIPAAMAEDAVAAEAGYITVGNAPVAEFDAAYAFDVVPATVTFTDRSTGTPPLAYLWDFGDGRTSDAQNPVHTYIRAGTYTVTLTVRNRYGTDTEQKPGFIGVGLAPRAAFTAEPVSGTAPLAVRFTDLSGGSPTSWRWDFGDGLSSAEQHPGHTYAAGGDYTVSLTASNRYGSSLATKTSLIRVSPSLTADFTASPRAGNTPLTVAFTDRSTGGPTAWAWDFGDGTTSAEQNPVHTYRTEGTASTNAYTVTLTARNAGMEDAERKANFITVRQGPVADFTVDKRAGKAPFTVTFRDLSLGNPTSWRWEFGDGTTSVEQHPVHQYAYEGSYDVRLTVSNRYGSDSVLKTGTSSPPKVTATVQPAATGTTAASPEPTLIPTPDLTLPASVPPATRAPVPLSISLCAVVTAILAVRALKGT